MVEIKHNIGMCDRRLDDLKRSTARSIRFAQASSRIWSLPTWCFISLGANGVMLMLLAIGGWRTTQVTAQAPITDHLLASIGTNLTVETSDDSPQIPATTNTTAQLGSRHQLTYQDWIAILEREAESMVTNPPAHLSILMGDSISLWFPHTLLPLNTTWLNQGISGEISSGLLKRLELIANTDPDVIFVMIGINDLLRDIDDDDILANQHQIVQDLEAMHPNATIVLQSILPHGGDRATWEGKDRLAEIPNERIQALNAELEAIATAEGIQFLNLAPLFTDSQGNLRMELSTDGLHLNDDGYLVWASVLQIYQQSIAQDL